MANSTTRITLTAKMGKKIEIIYKEESPNKIELVIKNNRGTTKDTLELDTIDFIERANTIETMHKLFKKED